MESKTFKKLEFDTTESFSENQVLHAGQFDEIIGKNNKLKKDLDTANITINNLIEEVKSYLKDISNQDKEIREKNIKISALTEMTENLAEDDELVFVDTSPTPTTKRIVPQYFFQFIRIA